MGLVEAQLQGHGHGGEQALVVWCCQELSVQHSLPQCPSLGFLPALALPAWPGLHQPLRPILVSTAVSSSVPYIATVRNERALCASVCNKAHVTYTFATLTTCKYLVPRY